MNRSKIVEEITQKEPYLNKQDVKQGLDILLSFVVKSLSEKKRIEIRGFGSFSVILRKGRMSRNPKTGHAVAIDSKFYPYFRSSKSIKYELNKP